MEEDYNALFGNYSDIPRAQGVFREYVNDFARLGCLRDGIDAIQQCTTPGSLEVKLLIILEQKERVCHVGGTGYTPSEPNGAWANGIRALEDSDK